MADTKFPNPEKFVAEAPGKRNWIFNAKLKRVVDGDTIDVIIDTGFHNFRTERLRLLHCNAPEMSTPEGKIIKNMVVEWMSGNSNLALWNQEDPEWNLTVKTFKTDAFGRYLALVWGYADTECLNEKVATWTRELVSKGVV